MFLFLHCHCSAHIRTFHMSVTSTFAFCDFYSKMSKPCFHDSYCAVLLFFTVNSIVHLKRDGTRAETRFCLSPKRTSPFKSAGASVQSTAGSQVVCISGSNAGYTMFRGSVRVLVTHSICQFPLHFPSRVSPCAIRFQMHFTSWQLLLGFC